jgi:AraC-like DNA-binding protein
VFGLDALTSILETVHFRGTLYCRSELSAPWGVTVPFDGVAHFHVVRRGRCWMSIGGGEQVLLEAGDLVVLPRGLVHGLSDSPGSIRVPLEQLVCGLNPGEPLVHGGGGDRTTLICGIFSYDGGSGAHPLLEVLPPRMIVRGEGGRAVGWLEGLLDLIARETSSRRPGAETVINRLTDALFIQIVRTHLDASSGFEMQQPSWLTGLRDDQIARTLGLIHRRPGERWSVDALAQQVGMSRSAFAHRFRELVGEPPLQYLTRWRMQVAADALTQGGLSLPQIAERVGYQAEAAFSKAFKKVWGVAPGTYRRNRHPSTAGPMVH